jgi:hypothetical protein
MRLIAYTNIDFRVVLAAARPNLAILLEVIKCASQRHEELNYVVERRAHDRIADIRLGRH